MFQKRDPQEIKPYLSDASNFPGGRADCVFFPQNECEVLELVLEADSKKIPLTIAGNGTGLAGARVPQGGWVLATERLNRIISAEKTPGSPGRIVTQPGVLLKDLQAGAGSLDCFYPAIPTSILSFIGGNLATNASGPQSFKYGATRQYVERIRLVTAQGFTIHLKRGQCRAKNGVFEIIAERNKKAETLRIPAPGYAMPSVKHSGGYYSRPEMDAVDLFIGTEGTLGIFTEIELKLLPSPSNILSFIAFFNQEEASWNFSAETAALSRANLMARNDAGLSACTMEYMDGASLDLIRDLYPGIPREARAGVSVEQECQPETKDMLLEQYSAFFEKHGAILEDEWISDDDSGREKFRAFRHDIPLRIREFLKTHGQKKVGTDFAVPSGKFQPLMKFQRERLAETGLPSATFGHIGDAHVHLNILPTNSEQTALGWNLYRELVDQVIQMGGSIAAEHGVGKIKGEFLLRMLGKKAFEDMRQIKKTLDPHGILGKGTLFPDDDPR